jgi:hypothetical protein
VERSCEASSADRELAQAKGAEDDSRTLSQEHSESITTARASKGAPEYCSEIGAPTVSSNVQASDSHRQGFCLLSVPEGNLIEPRMG